MVAMMNTKKKTLKVNASWILGNSSLNILILIVLTPYIITVIGSEQYGIYVLLGVINGVAGVMELGLVAATIYYVARYSEESDEEGVNRVFNATLCIHGLMVLTVFVLINHFRGEVCDIFGLHPSSGQSGETLVTLSAITFVFFSFFGTFSAIPQAAQRFDVFAKTQMARSLIQLLVSLVVLSSGYGLFGLVAANVGVAFLLFIVSVIVAKKIIPTLRITLVPTRKGAKEVLSYGVYGFASRLVGLAWQFGDTLIIGYLLGAKFVGFYSVPQQMFLRGFSLISMTGGMGRVLFPRFASITEKNERDHLYINATFIFLVLSMSIFIPLIVYIEDVITLWISASFAEKSAPIAQLLALAFAIRGAFVPYQALLAGVGKPKVIFYISFLSSSTVLISALILIPQYGLSGAGYANLLSTLWGGGAIIYVATSIAKLEEYSTFFIRLLLLWGSGIPLYYVIKILRSFFSESFGFVELLLAALISYATTCIYFIAILLLIGKRDVVMTFVHRIKI